VCAEEGVEIESPMTHTPPPFLHSIDFNGNGFATVLRGGGRGVAFFAYLNRNKSIICDNYVARVVVRFF